MHNTQIEGMPLLFKEIESSYIWQVTSSIGKVNSKEIVILVQNIHLVHLQDLTADFGVKTKCKVFVDFHAAREEQNWYSKLFVILT